MDKLSKLKQEAYNLKKSENIAHHEALDRIAKAHGFQHFYEARKVLSKTSNIFDGFKAHNLEKITDIVIKDLEELESKEEIIQWLKDLSTHGCSSGMVSRLIYYNDTSAFFETHKEEINLWLSEMIRDFGCTVDRLFGDEWDSSDPMAMDTNNKNLLAWAAYEQAGNNLLEFFE